MKQILLSIITLVSLAGCATTSQTTTPTQIATAVEPYVRPATAALASAALLTQAADKRAELAGYLYAAGQIVYSLSTGAAPTAEQLKSAISVAYAGPDSDQWMAIAGSVAAIYAGVYPSIQNKPDAALKIISGLAAGLEDAASIYIPKTNPS